MIKITLKLLFLTAFYFSALTACAQKSLLSYNYNIYNSLLPSNHIYRIVCDKNGSLWISTDNGLVNYNGNTFKTYDLKLDNDIVNLFYDNETDRLFALTYNSKLFVINTQTKSIKNIASASKVSGSFMYAYRDKRQLFFLTSTQRFRLDNDKLVEVPINNDIYKQYIDLNQSIFPQLNDRVIKKTNWNEIHEKHIRKSAKFWISNVRRFGRYNTISADGEVFIQQKGNYYSLIAPAKLPLQKSQFITDIEIDGNDLYIAIYGATGGVFLGKNYFSAPKQTTFERISDVGNCASLCKDKLGNIWYSLLGKGLYLIRRPDLDIRVMDIKNTIQDNGHFMAVNDTLALFKDGSSSSSQPIVINNSNGTITALAINDQRIPIAQRRIFYSLVALPAINKDVSHDKRMKFIKDRIMYISPLHKEETIFTQQGKIYRKGDYRGDTAILYAENDSIYLYNLVQKKIDRRILMNSLGALNDIYFLDKRRIILCSNNGVFLTDIGFSRLQKLSNKIFKKVLVKGNNVYFSNSQVIAHMDLGHLQIKQAFHVKSYAPNFSILDFDLSDHKIHLLTNIGYISINQSIIDATRNAISYSLEEIALKDSTIYKIQSPIQIERTQAKEIKFIVHFLNPENRFFEKNYSFTKTDEPTNWKIFTGDNFLQTNVSPGSYTLKIRARFSDSPTTALLTYSLVIKPAFWETNWFIAFSIVASIGAVALITWLIFKRSERKKLAMATLEKHIAEIENRAFLNQLNPHFLFNALNTLQNYILIKDVHNGIAYLQQVATLQRHILQFNSKSRITVTEEKEFLEKYLYVQQKRFNDKFAFSIHIQENALPLELPPMLLQPIVENIIEHGFAGQEPNKQLKIEFKRTHGHLQVTITDNGKGKIEHILPFKKGHALHIIKERLDFINIKSNTKTNSINFRAGQPIGIIVDLHIAIT